MKKTLTLCLLFCISLLATAQENVKLEMVDCFLDDCSILDEFPDIEFGYLTVPENYEIPDGNQVRIAFAIVRSRDENPKPDPILHLQGGWGTPTLDFISWIVPNFPVKNRDLILYDYRGTGYSEHALCPDLGQKQWELIIKDMEYREFNDSMNKLAYDCLELLQDQGIDYRQYGTEVKTMDAVVLLEKLGINEVNLYGISNGTLAIQGFIRAAENSDIKIRSAMSDSNVPMSYAMHGRVMRTYKNVLYSLLNDCARNPDCAKAFPDLKDRFYTFLRQMGDGALVYSGKEEAFFNLKDINGFIHQLLYSSYTYKDIPILLEAIMAEELTFLDRMFESLKSRILRMDGASLVSYVYDRKAEQEEVIKIAQRNFAEIPEFKLLSDYFLDFFINDTVMGFNPRDTIPVKSDVPVLLLAGSYDPITPPKLNDIMQERYSNSFNFVLSKIGHGAVLSPCGGELYRAFIENPTQKPPADCVGELLAAEIPFTTSYYPNQKVANLVIGIAQDRNIWLISTILLSVLFSLVLFFRQVILRIRKKSSQWMQLFLPAATIAFFAGLAYYIMQTVSAGGLLLLFGLAGNASWLPWLALLIMVFAAISIIQLFIKHRPSLWNIGMLVCAGLVVWIATTYQITPF